MGEQKESSRRTTRIGCRGTERDRCGVREERRGKKGERAGRKKGNLDEERKESRGRARVKR